MSKSVGVLGVNQLWSDKPYRHVARVEADTGCRTRKFRRVSQRLVQEIPGPATDGPIGVGHAIPFSRTSNPMVAPHKLHYEIPHAGDTSCYLRHHRAPIHVSGRTAREIRELEDIEWLRKALSYSPSSPDAEVEPD